MYRYMQIGQSHTDGDLGVSVYRSVTQLPGFHLSHVSHERGDLLNLGNIPEFLNY